MFDLSPILEEWQGKFIAVAFQDLETGSDYFLNADEPLHPASTYKVHVMMEVFRQANEGLFGLDDRLADTGLRRAVAGRIFRYCPGTGDKRSQKSPEDDSRTICSFRSGRRGERA